MLDGIPSSTSLMFLVISLTCCGCGGEAGVAGDGEAQHPLQLHLVLGALLLLLLPLEGAQPPHVRRPAIARHLQGRGSSLRLHGAESCQEEGSEEIKLLMEASHSYLT